MSVALWLGCVVHGVRDVLHFGRVEFIQDWYVAACLGLGAIVLLSLRAPSAVRDRPAPRDGDR